MPVKALKLDYVIVWGTKGDCPVPQLGFRAVTSSDRIVSEQQLSRQFCFEYV